MDYERLNPKRRVPTFLCHYELNPSIESSRTDLDYAKDKSVNNEPKSITWTEKELECNYYGMLQGERVLHMNYIVPPKKPELSETC